METCCEVCAYRTLKERICTHKMSDKTGKRTQPSHICDHFCIKNKEMFGRCGNCVSCGQSNGNYVCSNNSSPMCGKNVDIYDTCPYFGIDTPGVFPDGAFYDSLRCGICGEIGCYGHCEDEEDVCWICGESDCHGECLD